MPKTKIGFVLHIYQPPTQPDTVIQEVVRECYSPLMELVAHEPYAFISLDCAMSLAQKLPSQTQEMIRMLHAEKKIELVNTAAFHYLLPLVPDFVAKRQLALNKEFYEERLGGTGINGIWPPELAISPELPALFTGEGYRWCIADDDTFLYHRLSLPENRQVPQNWIPTIDGCEILLRSREWSNMMSWMRYPNNTLIHNGAEYLARLLQGQYLWRESLGNSQDSYIILAVDGETFGHHHKGAIENFLASFFREAAARKNECEIASLDTIVSHFPKTPMPHTALPAGSWSTSHDDMRMGIPYPCWEHPKNAFHRAWNRFMDTVFTYISFPNPNPRLQELLDEAFYSCSPWWAAKDQRDQRTIASWCIPLFEEIIMLARPPRYVTGPLQNDINAMRDFLAKK